MQKLLYKIIAQYSTIMKNVNNFTGINYTFMIFDILVDFDPLNNFQLVMKVDLL